MNSQHPPRKLSLPAVPISFLALVLLGAGLYWWFRSATPGVPELKRPFGGGIMEPFRTLGGMLHTNGLTKTEDLRKDAGKTWRGTTSSGIRLDATYRYDIELRSRDWNIFIDDNRKLAFVLAPPPQPQLPVAVDSKSVQEWTQSGWGRFDKWEQLQALRQEISPELERRARSKSYIELARGDARKTVEEFVSDWLLKSKGWPAGSEQFVKVYFADEADVPFPAGKTLKDFLP
jgi:hypothetical protein